VHCCISAMFFMFPRNHKWKLLFYLATFPSCARQDCFGLWLLMTARCSYSTVLFTRSTLVAALAKAERFERGGQVPLAPDLVRMEPPQFQGASTPSSDCKKLPDSLTDKQSHSAAPLFRRYCIFVSTALLSRFVTLKST